VTGDERARAQHVVAQPRRGLQADDERPGPPRRLAEAHDVRERHAELPGQRRSHEHVARRQMPAAQERLPAAGRAHGRAQAVVRVADARRGAPRIRQAGEPAGQGRHGHGQGQADRGERHGCQVARTREQRRQADAAEHADDRRRGRHEARQAGEAEQRHRGDERDPRQRAGGERAGRSRPFTGSEIRQRPDHRERQRDRPPQGLRGVAGAALRALGPPAPGAEQVGRQPQRGHGERHGEGDGPRARILAASTRPRRVGDQQQPALRSHERAEGTDHERGTDTAAQRRPHRAEDQRDEQRLGHPAGGLPRPCGHVVEEKHKDHHGKQRGGAPRWGGQTRRQAVRELAGEHERPEPRRAHEHEPQLRGSVAGQGERCGDQGGQRLPRRPARRVEAEVGQLAAPHEPRPGVVDRLVGDQQRGRSEPDAGRNDAEQAGGRHREIS